MGTVRLLPNSIFEHCALNIFRQDLLPRPRLTNFLGKMCSTFCCSGLSPDGIGRRAFGGFPNERLRCFLLIHVFPICLCP